MKSLSFGAALLFSIFISQFCFAQSTVKKDTIKVWGNCGMCKTKIEKAAKSAGATTAVWNEDSKQLRLAYNTTKTSNGKIQQAIADAGYDTQDKTATDEAYNNLHGCCQYERKTGVKVEATKCCDNKDCKKDAALCKDMACCKEGEGKAKEKSCCKM
jgi:periplasmic mercuric ion binding protein